MSNSPIMKSIQVHIGGHSFPMKVQESEIDTVLMIADYVNKKVSASRLQLKTMQENYILIHACLSIAEELFELRTNQPNAEQIEQQCLGRVNDKLDHLLDEFHG